MGISGTPESSRLQPDDGPHQDTRICVTLFSSAPLDLCTVTDLSVNDDDMSEREREYVCVCVCV